MTRRSIYANQVGWMLFCGIFVGCSPMVSQLSSLAEESPAADQASFDDEFDRAQPPAQVAGVSLTFVCEDQEEMDVDFIHLLCFFADSSGGQYVGDVDLSAVKLVSAAGDVEDLSFSPVDVGLAFRYEVAIPVVLIEDGVSLEAAYSVAGADGTPVDSAEAPQGDGPPEVKADPKPASTAFVLKPATVAKAKDVRDLREERDVGGGRAILEHSNGTNRSKCKKGCD